MTKPETLFEQASYELNQFRERRMAERRAVARDTPDRRRQPCTVPEPENRQQNSSQQTS